MRSKKDLTMLYILSILALTFIFLTSIFYKGWAFVLFTPAYISGIQLPSLTGKVALVTGFSDSSVVRRTVYELVLSGTESSLNVR